MPISNHEAVRRAIKRAREFDTPEALKKYLQDHPDADPKRHSVKTDEKKGPKKEEGGKSKPPPIPEEPKKKKGPPPVPDSAKKPESEEPSKAQKGAPKGKKPEKGTAPSESADGAKKPEQGRFDGWKKKFQHLSQKAQAFVESSSKSVKQFIGDEQFREQALKEASNVLKSAPGTLKKNLVEVLKHEKHEFALAGRGVKNVLSGKKMSKKEKKAFQTVTTHLSIAAAAAAFTATGPLAGAAAFTKGLATHVAAKADHKSLANLHLMQEMGHIGHGVKHLLEHIASEEEPQASEEEPQATEEEGSDEGLGDDAETGDVMIELVMALVASEIDSLGDDDLEEVLEGMDEVSEEGASEEGEEAEVNNEDAALDVDDQTPADPYGPQPGQQEAAGMLPHEKQARRVARRFLR